MDKAYTIASIKACIPTPLDLDKLNYNSWSELFKCFCKTYNVDNHVAATTSSSTDTDFASNDSLVVMWIYATISSKLVDMVLNPSATAKNIWDHLQKVFHDNKHARVIQLDNEIRNMQIGDLSITDYFQAIKSKVDRLANLGSTISDTSLITYDINGLGAKYPEVARIIRHRETLPDFDTTRSMLLLEESIANNINNTQFSLHTTTMSPIPQFHV
ncbi:hypothetical protein Tco_1098876 [Tanacetum coccineum]